MKTINRISELEECQKRFIAHQYACYVEPIVLQGMLREIYDIHMPVDLLVKMNPGLPNLCVMEEKWFNHFQKVRDDLIDTPFQFPVTDKFQRIIWLQALYERAKADDDVELMLKIFDVARNETGPIYEELVRQLKLAGGSRFDQGPFEA